MIQPHTILMIDPPWPKQKGGMRKVRPNQGKMLDYNTMELEDIFSLLDADILPVTTDHCVFMWCIEQFLVKCERQMQLRGYKRHCRFIWDKGNGIAPAVTVRFSHEYLIWYYKSRLLPVASTCRGVFQTVFREPPRQHSRKPDFAYRMIEQLYPEHLKMDVFSREQRPHWNQYGNQLNHFKSQTI